MFTRLVTSLIVIPTAVFSVEEKRDCIYQARVELFVSVRGAFDFLAMWQRRKDSPAL